MDFELDDQQRTLRDEARRFLEAEAPIAYAREMLTDARGWRDDIHARMADLGWLALPFDEQHGGLGLGFVAQAILLTEMGRVVLPGPYLSSILGGLAIQTAGSDEQRTRLLPSIATGERSATLAVASAPGDARFVIDGATADIVVVAADDGLLLVEPTAREEVTTIDRTRRVAHVRYDGGEPMSGSPQRALDLAAVALAAEMLGGCERVVEMSVEYAQQREQFGRPIGSFQAVKHRAATMKLELESLRNGVTYAAWALERGHEDAQMMSSVAKAYASDAYRTITQSGIQIHGGVGFTWEHDMHLFFKRAKFDENAFGDATHHRERVAALLEARAG